MYTALTIFAALLGLAVTGSAVYTAWYVFTLQRKNPDQEKPDPAVFLRWTFFDYALLFLTLTGLIFLLVDVIGVIKDRDSYPYYHYGYLVSGFVFVMLGLLLLLGRLFLVLRLADQRPSAPNQHHEPNQTYHAE